MGWLVPAIWLAALAMSSQVPARLLEQYGIGTHQVPFIFLAAAAVSTPLLFVAGKMLNRDKKPRKIVRFGKEKIVNWGSHTFNTLPIEYWAIMIPIFTILFCAIFTLI
jgi:hypothetical protein